VLAAGGTGCRVQQQRRVVYAAAAPEGVNAEQVADLIAAAPLDDGREYLTPSCLLQCNQISPAAALLANEPQSGCCQKHSRLQAALPP
jgi:hypothetical protein